MNRRENNTHAFGLCSTSIFASRVRPDYTVDSELTALTALKSGAHQFKLTKLLNCIKVNNKE
jgi:hypothetical protein